MKAVSKENIEKITKYFKEFGEWVAEWQKEFPDFGLTSPTFQALLQTVEATSELCRYLLDDGDNGIEYILLGFLQQDFLEGRFGWYRQLSGGNYYCAVVQFLQAEKTIRLRNLVDLGMSMKDINAIFAPAKEKASLLTKARGKEFSKMLYDFKFKAPIFDVAATYYVSRYISRQLLKSTSCASCKNMFLDNQEDLPLNEDEAVSSSDAIEIEEGKSFIEAITGGGLASWVFLSKKLVWYLVSFYIEMICYARDF